MDVMTSVAIKLSGFPEHRVFGSGTVLDTARFRTLLGYHLGISPKSIHANVLGEHGDSEVLIWSHAVAGTVQVEELAKNIQKPLGKEEIDDNVRNAAYKIINGKGSTTFGIAGALCRICQAIGSNEYAILNVSSFHKEFEGVRDLCISMPCIVGKRGIHSKLKPQFSKEEHDLLRKSTEIIKSFTDTALRYIK
jgi:L-lactate dehydrogenase